MPMFGMYRAMVYATRTVSSVRVLRTDLRSILFIVSKLRYIYRPWFLCLDLQNYL